MVLKTTLAAGLALGLGGQAFAMTCADNEKASAFFVNCGVDASESQVPGLLASLNTGVPANAMSSSVANAVNVANTGGSAIAAAPSGLSGGFCFRRRVRFHPGFGRDPRR